MVDEQSFEQRKWAEELELKKRELALKEKDSSPSVFKNPIVITVLSAIVAGLIGVITNFVDSSNKIAQEERKSDLALLTDLIKARDQNLIRKNLEFLVDAKVIRNQGLRRDLQAYLKKVRTENLPAITNQLVTKDNVAAFDICANIADSKVSIQYAPLTDSTLRELSQEFSVDVPTLQAFFYVESVAGRLKRGHPRILFERHIFQRLTGGRFASESPDVSNARPGGYKGGYAEYARLQKAAALDCDSALSATSWGAGQIMGQNYARAGFSDVKAFARAMLLSEPDTLRAIMNFLKSANVLNDLRAHNWAEVARKYNGPGYVRSGYDTKLERAYAFYSGA